MKVTMTNKELVDSVNRTVSMQNREAENHEKLFSIKVNYAIRKNKAAMLAALKPYDEALDELREECKSSERNADGSVKIRKDCLDQWEKGIRELQSIEVDVDVHMVKFSEIEKLSLSMNDMEAICFMLDGEPRGFDE